MKVARRLMSGVALTLVIAACGDDAVEPEAVLTEEEAVALFKAMKTQQVDSTTVLIHFSEDSLVVECPGGGQAKLVGPLGEPDTTVADTLRLVTDVVITPRQCGLTGDGREFIVDGNPSVRDKMITDIPLLDFVPSTSGSFAGDVKWQLNDDSGSCAMDLTLTDELDGSDPDAPKYKLIYKGSLCDYEVEIELALPLFWWAGDGGG